MKLTSLILPALFIVLAPSSVLAGDVAAGKVKAVMCTSCHGANGKAMIPTYPSLAGQNEQYLIMALNAYKGGKRTGGQAGIMAGMSAGLSDADIANLAAYYSAM